MELSIRPEYSENGIQNRAILNSAHYPVILYVEDSGKEFKYEGILKRMFGHNGMPDRSILDIINIISLGGKPKVVDKVKEQGSYDREKNQHYVYLMDGDFDRYIEPYSMIKAPNVIYLEAYCIENYFLDEEACINFIQSKNQERDIDVRNKLNFTRWRKRITTEASELFFYFACARKFSKEHKGSGKVPDGVSKAFSQLDRSTGFIDLIRTNNKIKEIQDVVYDYQDTLIVAKEEYFRIHGNDYFYLICGKFLFKSLTFYIKSVFGLTNFQDNDLIREMERNFDIGKLHNLKYALDQAILHVRGAN